jgi:hypothetical protein
MLGCEQTPFVSISSQGRTTMSGKTSGGQNRQSANMSEEDLAKQRAGVKQKSSHDHMARQKAGEGQGAGGGAKQGSRKGTGGKGS